MTSRNIIKLRTSLYIMQYYILVVLFLQIEREVIVTSSVEKSSNTFKARILPEFGVPSGASSSRLQPVHSPRGHHRPPSGAIAPDAPARQFAWTQDSIPKVTIVMYLFQLFPSDPINFKLKFICFNFSKIRFCILHLIVLICFAFLN